MYEILYKLYFFLKRVQKKKTEKGKEQSYIIKRTLDYIERYYNEYFKNSIIRHPSDKYGLNTAPREQKIIVSLTSFPKRIGDVWLTIETLLSQSVKPDKIILWLADSQFDGLDSLPPQLLNLQKRGLEIRFCDDLRSHKKYFYVMQEYSEDIVILVDDDMFYPTDTVSGLLKIHEKYPTDICTMTAQYIAGGIKAMPSFWRNPCLNERFEHSDEIQVFTGSGSLYPPHSLHNETFNKKLIKKLCPYADDLWLTYMSLKNGTKITMETPWRAFPVTIYGTGDESLWHINAAQGKNDEQWHTILKYFGEI